MWCILSESCSSPSSCCWVSGIHKSDHRNMGPLFFQWLGMTHSLWSHAFMFMVVISIYHLVAKHFHPNEESNGPPRIAAPVHPFQVCPCMYLYWQFLNSTALLWVCRCGWFLVSLKKKCPVFSPLTWKHFFVSTALDTLQSKNQTLSVFLYLFLVQGR